MKKSAHILCKFIDSSFSAYLSVLNLWHLMIDIHMMFYRQDKDNLYIFMDGTYQTTFYYPLLIAKFVNNPN